MGKPDQQTDHGHTGGEPGQPAGPFGEAASGDTPVGDADFAERDFADPHDQRPRHEETDAADSRERAEAKSSKSEEPDDWGFSREKRGMSTETKIGLTLVVLLLGTFGFVVWKKLQQRQTTIAATDFAEHPESRPERRDPPVNRRPKPQERPEDVVHADAFEEPTRRGQGRHDDGWAEIQPVSRETPRHDDPFAELDPENFRNHEVQKPPAEGHRGVEEPAFADLFEPDPRQPATEPKPEECPPDGGLAEYEFADDFDFGASEQHRPRNQQPRDDFGRRDFGRRDFGRDDFGRDDFGRRDERVVDAWDQEPGRLEIAEFDDPRIRQTRGVAATNDAGWDDFEPVQQRQQPRPRQDVAQRQPAEAGWDDFETFEPVDAHPRNPRQDPRRDEFRQDQPRQQDFRQDARRDDFGRDAFEQHPTQRHQQTNWNDAPPAEHQACEDPTAPPGTTVHEVEAGDSYWTISRDAYDTAKYFSALAKFNEYRIANPKHMRPGMLVLCPPTAYLHQRYPKLCGPGEDAKACPHENPEGFFVDADGRPKYRVGEEDTLSEIAHVHLGRGSRWVQIFELNRGRLRTPDTLPLGTVLDLPADASSVRLVGGTRTYR